MISNAEKKLVNLALQGDGAAISELYQTHKEAVYRFLYYRVGTQPDAEDLFQEVMMAAFESLPRFRGEVPFLHWCYQIARNKVAMFWREKSKHATAEWDDNMAPSTPFEEEEPLPEEEGLEEARLEKCRSRAQEVLTQLPERYATLLKLRFWDRKTLREIA